MLSLSGAPGDYSMSLSEDGGGGVRYYPELL